MLQGHADHDRSVRQQGVQHRAFFASREEQLARLPVCRIEADRCREDLAGDLQCLGVRRAAVWEPLASSVMLP